MISLDLKDKKILYHLDLNSRQSNTEIAKKIRLSKDAVGYRIKRLEQEGIIRGYRAVIDSSRLGYLFYRVLLNIIDINPLKLRELTKFLETEKNVWWIAELDGAWNFIFAIWVKSNKEFQEFYLKLSDEFRENIKEKLICPMVSYKNINRKYLLEKVNKERITSTGDGEKQEFDNLDMEILQALSRNARCPLIEIAKKINKDSMTVFHRIKRLENCGIIQGYNVDLDSNKIGRDFYSVKINLKKMNQIKVIKAFLTTIPEVTAMTEAIGSYDIEFDLEVESSEKYFQIIKELQTRFDSIREISYFRVLKNYKILYLPEE